MVAKPKAKSSMGPPPDIPCTMQSEAMLQGLVKDKTSLADALMKRDKEYIQEPSITANKATKDTWMTYTVNMTMKVMLVHVKKFIFDQISLEAQQKMVEKIDRYSESSAKVKEIHMDADPSYKTSRPLSPRSLWTRKRQPSNYSK